MSIRPSFETWTAGRGGVDFIVSQIIDEDRYDTPGLKSLARQLRGKNDNETFFNTWKWVRENVRYVPDGRQEKVKSAYRTIWDGFADCKSMSILTAALLRENGYRYFYRVTGYDRNNPERGHIYVMALTVKNAPFPVDPVNRNFGGQEKWVWKKDMVVMSKPGQQQPVHRINGMIEL